MSIVALREWRLTESATSCRQIRFQIVRLLKPKKYGEDKMTRTWK